MNNKDKSLYLGDVTKRVAKIDSEDQIRWRIGAGTWRLPFVEAIFHTFLISTNETKNVTHSSTTSSFWVEENLKTEIWHHIKDDLTLYNEIIPIQTF